MLNLELSNKGNSDVKYLMSIHYSQPKGFVGRQIIYKIYDDELFLGVVVGGSATLHLPNRNEFFGDNFDLNKIINNTFFHLLPHEDKNLGTKILKLWRKQVVIDWENKYYCKPIGFESLIELPRSGSLYKADNWTYVGTTKGYTCKRTGGVKTENWTGKRVWDYKNLKPKLVYCKKI
jgi:hypothetical protein